MFGAARKDGFPADLHQDLGQWPRERPPRRREDMTRRPGSAHPHGERRLHRQTHRPVKSAGAGTTTFRSTVQFPNEVRLLNAAIRTLPRRRWTCRHDQACNAARAACCRRFLMLPPRAGEEAHRGLHARRARACRAREHEGLPRRRAVRARCRRRSRGCRRVAEPEGGASRAGLEVHPPPGRPVG